MQDGNAIEVRNITKKFKVYYDKGESLKEKVIFWKRNRYEERWVLNGISFDVKKGEAIGLIGKNGCGKSTTLKMLTRIMYPDSGSIEIKGRVSSLIELGAGFHPDMSGRENIYTNASIFGLSKKEIDQRLQEIIDFSEMEEFLDNPVRTYSSGMYMRLAFAVAINVDADVLLIDEILGVGDVSFQKKCFEKLKEIKANGTTIVIVSHSLEQIEKICEKSIWIEDGKIKEVGMPQLVHEHYKSEMEEKRLIKNKITVRHRGGGSKTKYRIIDFKRNKDGVPAKVAGIEYDPNRSANIALLHYADGEKRYILAPLGLKDGDILMSGENAEIKVGNCLPLKNIPVGSNIHNIELVPGKGGQMVRSAGNVAQLMAKEGKYATLRLPSGEMRLVPINCRATIGQVGNADHELIKIGKAGRKRHMGIRPTVRGSVMNPNDHPHGGGEGRSPIGRPSPMTPWGKPALGYKTRNKKKKSNKYIVRSRAMNKK